jgi:hypothetical protein
MAPIELGQAASIISKYFDLTNTESKENASASDNLPIKAIKSPVGAPSISAGAADPTSLAALTPSSAAAAAPALITQPSPGAAPALSPAATPKGKSAWVQWSALFGGILIQPFFQAYQASSTHTWSFNGFGGWTLFALITSVVIFPAVYKKAFDQDSPAIVQLAPIFTAGLGWQSLLTTAIKIVAH